MITVIADDITGAAEIAGIGFRFGLRVALVIDAGAGFPEVDLLVYATDTRSMHRYQAEEESRRVVRQLQGCRAFFKKTDSVLRGHVMPELEVLLEELGLPKALYLPENPSKGRVVRGGVYYIDGQPLDQTFFANDPEFPALSPKVMKQVPGLSAVLSPGKPLDGPGVFAANAESDADIETHLAQTDDQTLLAGGADLFVVWLRRLGWKEQARPAFGGLGDRDALVVCGSTVQHSFSEFDYFRRKKIPFETMPSEVFELERSPESWFADLGEAYERNRSLVVAVGPHPRREGKHPFRLRNVMALAVSSLVAARRPDELIVEGGSTAYTVLKALGWDRFRITDEIAPGVVRMALDNDPEAHDMEGRGVSITLKPGSYPWGDALFR